MPRYFNRSYICRLFREMGRPISKQTLHRLEVQGFFDPPPLKGGGNEERLFTKEHVQKLWEHWFGDANLPEQLAS
jgi:hypothetical protein